MIVGYSRTFGGGVTLEEVTVEATLSASSNEGGFPVSNLADNNGSTQWVSTASNTQWVQADFGAGNAKDVRRIAIQAYTSVADRVPNTWVLAGSNTGTFSGEETVVHSVSGGAFYSAGEEKVFDFSNGSTFRYYRLTMTGKEGAFGFGNEYQFAEWEVHAVA